MAVVDVMLRTLVLMKEGQRRMDVRVSMLSNFFKHRLRAPTRPGVVCMDY